MEKRMMITWRYMGIDNERWPSVGRVSVRDWNKGCFGDDYNGNGDNGE